MLSMARNAASLVPEKGRNAGSGLRMTGHLPICLLLLLMVTCAWGEVDFGLGRDDGAEDATLEWWVLALEWGAGTAVGTGLGVLRDEVGPIQIPSANNSGLNRLIFTLNNGIIPIAVSPHFGCAAGCDAVGLSTRKEGNIWYGAVVGGIVTAASQPLGSWVQARTGRPGQCRGGGRLPRGLVGRRLARSCERADPWDRGDVGTAVALPPDRDD